MKKILVAALILHSRIKTTPQPGISARAQEKRTRPCSIPLKKSAEDTWLDTIRFESLATIKKEYAKSPWLVHASDKRGNTAMHTAALCQSRRVIRYLIHHNANVNALNNQGLTPLHVAAASNNRHTAQFLLKNGANWDITNTQNKTALDVAQESVRELLDSYTQCPICIGKASFDTHTRTPCNHIFCTECLKQWTDQQRQAQQNPQCPQCRARLPEPPRNNPIWNLLHTLPHLFIGF